VAEAAAEAIADFLKAKKLFACDLLELGPVKALAKSPKHLHLYQLLNAVVRGQMDRVVHRPLLSFALDFVSS